MSILAFDYGRKKIGVAKSFGSLASPLTVFVGEKKELLDKVVSLVNLEKPEKIVIGLSSGDIKSEAKLFGKDIEEFTKVKVVYFDETLSTFDAQVMSIEAGMKRKKRKEKEDSFAATIILQRYLDK